MIDHLADLESDFSRFHRVDDIYALDGPRFFRLAYRIVVYGGVVAMRARAELERAAEPAPAVSPAPRPTPVLLGRQQANGDRVLPAAAFAAVHADVVEMRRGA